MGESELRRIHMKPNHGWEDNNRIEENSMGRLGFDPPVSKQGLYASIMVTVINSPVPLNAANLLTS